MMVRRAMGDLNCPGDPGCPGYVDPASDSVSSLALLEDILANQMNAATAPQWTQYLPWIVGGGMLILLVAAMGGRR